MALMIAAVGSVLTVIITLYLVVIMIKFFGDTDDEENNILQEIQLLREDLQVSNNIIILDSTRYAILGGKSGFISKDGIPEVSGPWDMETLKEESGTPILLLAIKKGEGSFLNAIPGMKF